MSKAGYFGWFVFNAALGVVNCFDGSWRWLPVNLAGASYCAYKYYKE